MFWTCHNREWNLFYYIPKYKGGWFDARCIFSDFDMIWNGFWGFMFKLVFPEQQRIQTGFFGKKNKKRELV